MTLEGLSSCLETFMFALPHPMMRLCVHRRCESPWGDSHLWFKSTDMYQRIHLYIKLLIYR